MKQTLSVLFLMTLFFSSCSSTHNLYQSSNGLPNNPDPNRCYVRTTTPDVYETSTEEHLTYSQADADKYSHKIRKIMTSPPISRWEYERYKGCKSINPTDCMALCFREYPAIQEIIYIPLDTTKGTPFIKDIEVSRLVQKGGIVSYEEVSCAFLEYNSLPILFPTKSAELSIEAMNIIDESILKIMKDIPNIKIEISSHTNSRGASADNQLLSEQRAQSIVDYLKDNGIAIGYLKAVGFGEKSLKNRCTDGVSCTDEQHAVNERIEFRLLNY